MRLTWIVFFLVVIIWTTMVCVYFRREIFEWWDNRFGPAHVEKKPPKPQRKRRYG